MYSTHSAPIDHASSNTHFKYSTRVFSFRPSRDHAKGQNHNPEVPRSQKVIVSHDKAMIGSLWISNFLMALMSWGSWFWKWIFVGAWLHEEHLPVACLLYQKRLPTILHPKLPLQPGCCSKTRTHFVNTLGKPPFVVMKGLRVTDDQHQHANGLGRRLCDFQRQPFCLLKLPWLDSEWATDLAEGGWVPLTHWHCPKALFGGSSPAISAMQQSKGNPKKLNFWDGTPACLDLLTKMSFSR